MRIQHNITAMNAHRQLGINNTSVGKNLEKLSSGFRINRAGDDAAGLAISEKMRGQIRGLDMASNNAQDGISLIQTAEGNLQETHSILQRMRELAVQSSNGTFETVNDRENLDKEVQALKSEIDRISNSAHFNNTKLLDGNLSKTPVAPGTTPAVASKIEATTENGQVGSSGDKAVYEVDLAGVSAGTIKVFGATNGVAFDTDAAKTATNITAALNGTANTKGLAGFTYKAEGSKIIATANTAGKIDQTASTGVHAVMSKAVDGATDIVSTASTNTTVGTNAGAGSAEKHAAFKFDIDFSKIRGGDTFSVGGKTFEFSTSGVASAVGNEVIDLKGLDLTTVGTSTTGQWGATKITVDTLNTKLTAANWTAAGIPATAPAAAGVLSITVKAVATGAAKGTLGNSGAPRPTGSGVVATQTVFGAAEGPVSPTKFAKATLEVDFTKFKVGDTVTFNGKTYEAIKTGETADATKNQFALGADADATAASFINAIESSGFDAGKMTYKAADKALTIQSTDATQTSAEFAASLGAVKFTPKAAAGASAPLDGVIFQIGANGTADDRVNLTIEKQDTVTLGIGDINITDIPSANAAIDALTIATNKVSGTRADLGALQNRLEHTVANLGTTSENLTAAESRIRDVDMAKEMMEMTKNNILSQAAQAMLAQANQQPQGILQLLR